MTTASLAKHIPDSLLEAPKSELAQMVVRARSLAKNYKLKEAAAHTGKTLLCTVVGGVGGVTAGALAAFPMFAHLPKTRIRTDLIVGGLIAGLGAFEVFDGASRYIAEYGNGMIDYGMGDMTKNAIVAWRAKQGAAPAAAPAAKPRAA